MNKGMTPEEIKRIIEEHENKQRQQGIVYDEPEKVSSVENEIKNEIKAPENKPEIKRDEKILDDGFQWKEIDVLPSHKKLYPDTKFYIRQLTLPELEVLVNIDEDLYELVIIDLLSKAVKTSNPKYSFEDLTMGDIEWITLILKNMTTPDSSWSVTYTCPFCGAKDTVSISPTMLQFEEIKVDLPVRIKGIFGFDELRLKPIRIKDTLWYQDYTNEKGYSDVALLLAQYVFEDQRDEFLERYSKSSDIKALMTIQKVVDGYFKHGLKEENKFTVRCKKCEKKFEIDVDFDSKDLLTEDNESDSNGFEIVFGSSS